MQSEEFDYELSKSEEFGGEVIPHYMLDCWVYITFKDWGQLSPFLGLQ